MAASVCQVWATAQHQKLPNKDNLFCHLFLVSWLWLSSWRSNESTALRRCFCAEPASVLLLLNTDYQINYWSSCSSSKAELWCLWWVSWTFAFLTSSVLRLIGSMWTVMVHQSICSLFLTKPELVAHTPKTDQTPTKHLFFLLFFFWPGLAFCDSKILLGALEGSVLL